MSSRRERRERRQANKIAVSMEKLILRGAFRQELAALNLNECDTGVSPQKQMEQLVDKRCLGILAGVSLGLPEGDLQKVMDEFEPRGLRFIKVQHEGGAYFVPVLDKDVE